MKDLLNSWNQYPGSVVPLAMYTRRSRRDVRHSVTQLLPDWWLAMTLLMWLWRVKMASGDLNDVTLVTEEAFKRLDWCYSGYWGGFLETWLMWLWLLRMPFRELTDVTLVSDEILRRLDWCDSGAWRCLLEIWLMWLWRVMITFGDLTDDLKMASRDLTDVALVSGEWGSKLSIEANESCLLMKVAQWWKLSFDESCNSN